MGSEGRDWVAGLERVVSVILTERVRFEQEEGEGVRQEDRWRKCQVE